MNPDSVFGLEWSEQAGADYIGDAVYVRMDGDTVILRTDRRYEQHVIGLEPETLKALNEYVIRQGAP